MFVTNGKNYTRGYGGLVSTVFWVFGKSSLLTMFGKNHKKHKTIINRIIKNEQLINITDITAECTSRLIQHWKKLMLDEHVSNVTVDIYEHMKSVTLNITGLLVLGKNFDCITNKCYIVKEIENLLGMQRWTVSMAANVFEIINPHLSRIFNTQRLFSGAYGVRKYLKNFIKAKTDNNTAANNFTCISDFLIDENSLSNEEIEDELFTLLFAGVDTTSVALTYTIYCLSKYPNWQKKCRKEIKVLINDCGDEFSWCKVRQLKIVSSVVKESLRLYSPGPVIPRQSIDGDYLDGNGMLKMC